MVFYINSNLVMVCQSNLKNILNIFKIFHLTVIQIMNTFKSYLKNYIKLWDIHMTNSLIGILNGKLEILMIILKNLNNNYF